MIKLNIISLDDENTIAISPTIFPDKSSQIWKLPEFVFYEQYKSYTILWDFENESEIMHVLQLARLIGFTKHIKPNLFMPFLPYGRQDKTISNNNTFALKVFADVLVKSGSFEVISTLDAHNELFTRIHGIQNIQPTEQIKYAIKAVKPDLIVFPDQGAAKRGYNVQGLESIILDKKRNQLTGEIEGLVYEGTVSVGDKSLLIVDDLCDRGGTFIKAARLLKDIDCGEISLYTTHGLYTGGIELIKNGGISRLFDKSGERFE